MFHAAVNTLEADEIISVQAAASDGWKRALDVAVALFALILFAPLLVCIAAAVRLESQGPALFRQSRGGVMGRPFTVLKFRTMTTADNGDQIVQATRGDQRITRVGAVLRRLSLDELPQLINVLRGDMSIVGPRPHALAHDRHYLGLIPDYRRRFAVKPGITGLAQVRGHRGETSTVRAMADRVASDLEYVSRWTLALDLQIMIRTLWAPMQKNAY